VFLIAANRRHGSPKASPNREWSSVLEKPTDEVQLRDARDSFTIARAAISPR
jgi:hypothetical protein